MTSFRFRRWTLFPVLLLSLSQAFAGLQVNVVGDMYADGRKAIPATPDKPVYYYPIVRDFSDIGPGAAGEQVPSKKDFIHNLASVLSTQGYRVTHEVTVPAAGNSSPAPVVKAFAGPPTLVLVFDWGALHAETLDGGLGGDATTSAAPPEVMNKGQMIGMTAGKDFDNVADFGLKSQEIMEQLGSDRYFVMVSAYDFAAYFQHHKKVRLWVAKWSMPLAGTTMADAMPVLIKTGGPMMGRETAGPKIFTFPDVPDGTVKVGTPTVVGH